jgi:hypothetical protein
MVYSSLSFGVVDPALIGSTESVNLVVLSVITDGLGGCGGGGGVGVLLGLLFELSDI